MKKRVSINDSIKMVAERDAAYLNSVKTWNVELITGEVIEVQAVHLYEAKAQVLAERGRVRIYEITEKKVS